MTQALPNELCDRIIDHLHDSPAALATCSLVCSSWLSAAWYHTFAQRHLTQAVRDGRSRIVELLLARPGIDVNVQGYAYPVSDARNIFGRIVSNIAGETPLLVAVQYSCSEIVNLILRRPDVNTELADLRGSTPLARAALHGGEEAVSLLMARGDVDVNSKDSYGTTPLICGASCG